MAGQSLLGASLGAATPNASTEKPAAVPKPRQKARLSHPESLVTLVAGEGDSSKKFVMHKDFACHYSPVLKAAFNSDFLEGQTQVYKLSKASEDVVNLLVHWFYTQEVIADSEIVSCAMREVLMFCQLWIIADSLLIPRLQNAAIDKMIELQDKFGFTAVNCVDTVYAHTAAKSPLRTMLLHRCMCMLDPEWITSNPDMFPKEMLLEMVLFTCQIKGRAFLIRQTGIKSNPGQYNVPEVSEA